VVADVPEGFDRGGCRPASGIPARGYRWEPFREGNQVSKKHGAYSALTLAPRAEELRELIGSQLDPSDAQEFSLLVSTAAALAAQTERAFLALQDPVDPATSDRLGRDARGWAKLWLAALKSLNLTPQAARQAARDAGHLRLAQHLADMYGEVEEVTDG